MKRQYGTRSITWISEGKAKLLPARHRGRLGPGNRPHRLSVSAHQHRAPLAERETGESGFIDRYREGVVYPEEFTTVLRSYKNSNWGYRRISNAKSTTSATKST